MRLLTAAQLLPVKRMDAASSKFSKGFLLTTGCDSHVFLQPLWQVNSDDNMLPTAFLFCWLTTSPHFWHSLSKLFWFGVKTKNSFSLLGFWVNPSTLSSGTSWSASSSRCFPIVGHFTVNVTVFIVYVKIIKIFIIALKTLFFQQLGRGIGAESVIIMGRKHYTLHLKDVLAKNNCDPLTPSILWHPQMMAHDMAHFGQGGEFENLSSLTRHTFSVWTAMLLKITGSQQHWMPVSRIPGCKRSNSSWSWTFKTSSKGNLKHCYSQGPEGLPLSDRINEEVFIAYLKKY